MKKGEGGICFAINRKKQHLAGVCDERNIGLVWHRFKMGI